MRKLIDFPEGVGSLLERVTNYWYDKRFNCFKDTVLELLDKALKAEGY